MSKSRNKKRQLARKRMDSEERKERNARKRARRQ